MPDTYQDDNEETSGILTQEITAFRAIRPTFPDTFKRSNNNNEDNDDAGSDTSTEPVRRVFPAPEVVNSQKTISMLTRFDNAPGDPDFRDNTGDSEHEKLYMIETALAAVRQAAVEALRGLLQRFGLKGWEKEVDYETREWARILATNYWAWRAQTEQREDHNEDLNEMKVTIHVYLEKAKRAIINAMVRVIQQQTRVLEEKIQETKAAVERKTAKLGERMQTVLASSTYNMDFIAEHIQLLNGRTNIMQGRWAQARKATNTTQRQETIPAVLSHTTKDTPTHTPEPTNEEGGNAMDVHYGGMGNSGYKPERKAREGKLQGKGGRGPQYQRAKKLAPEPRMDTVKPEPRNTGKKDESQRQIHDAEEKDEVPKPDTPSKPKNNTAAQTSTGNTDRKESRKPETPPLKNRFWQARVFGAQSGHEISEDSASRSIFEHKKAMRDRIKRNLGPDAPYIGQNRTAGAQ
ncbi:hypothetical protein BDZ91DRAFT_799840 [Kalaharituber pfeilii]|nr:hypothetical protein BDZ91DRAFT_799840 [Kalaharituber pfeilii]